MAESKSTVCVALIFLSAVISLTNCAKLSRSNNHDSRRGDSDSDAENSSLETLLLRDKLNLLLDAESREVGLLKTLLDEQKEEATTVDKNSEKNEMDNSYKSQSDSWTTSTSSPTTTITSNLPSTKGKEKVGKGKEHAPSLELLRVLGIVNKLEDNSKRMGKMVTLMVDLRNILTEALTSQNRQMVAQSEMVEIRDELAYLRKEVQTLKKEKRSMLSSSSVSGSGAQNINLENKVHNNEATIEWLKNSTMEIRRQMNEISESGSTIVQMKEQMNKESERRKADLSGIEKELEKIRLKQLLQDEALNEAKTDIKDLRKWQNQMGRKFIENKSTTSDTTSRFPQDEDDEQDGSNDVNQEKSNSIEFGEEHFITEALKESVGKPFRHGNKRLKAKVHELQTVIQDLAKDNKNCQRRLMKIENAQRSLKSMTSNLREALSHAGLISPSSSLTNEVHPNGSNADPNSNVRLSKRIESLENIIQEFVITSESLNNKIGEITEVKENSAVLFSTIETFETTYDERITELHTSLARIESSVNSVQIVNEDLKEEQTQQSGQMQNIKKELFQTMGKLQANHLRLASIQSQMVKWVSEKCSDENAESIQNIRIATLEHRILDLQTPSSTSTTSNNN